MKRYSSLLVQIDKNSHQQAQKRQSDQQSNCRFNLLRKNINRLSALTERQLTKDIIMSQTKNVNSQKLIGGSYPIALMGESGQGKSTSFRHLNPDTTFFIDADKKGLPWRGWKQNWVDRKNYIQTSDSNLIMQWINHVNHQLTNISTLIIDTVNSVMIDNEMSRAKEKGFEKWTDLAKGVYDLINMGLNVRSNLHVIYVFHSETSRNLDGVENWTRIRTSGKKLESIVIESKFPIVLLAKSRRDDAGHHYFFETQSFNSTAKSPDGMFKSFEISNDIASILKIVDEYELGNYHPEQQQPQQQQQTNAHSVEKHVTAEELEKVNANIRLLGPEYQKLLEQWLHKHNASSIAQLNSKKFEEVRLRIDQKLSKLKVQKTANIVRLTELAKNIPPIWLARYAGFTIEDEATTITNFPDEIVTSLLEKWDTVKKTWETHKPISEKQLKELHSLISGKELTEKEVLDHLQTKDVHLNSLSKLPSNAFTALCDEILILAEIS